MKHPIQNFITHTLKISLGTFVILLAGCRNEPSQSPSPMPLSQVIPIGVVAPLTGSEAGAGQSIRKGVELKVKQLNSAGGIQGKKIELIVLDDRGKPEESALATLNLINQKKVRAIIGTLTSSGTLAMAPLALEHHIPLIAPTATHPKVTEAGDEIFRICFVESLQGKAMAQFAFEKLKARRIAVLYDSKSDYSLGLKTHFSQTLKEKGGEIILEQSFSAGDIDFKSQLTSIRAKKPDALFIPAYYTEAALIARQARELGLALPLLGGDGWDSPRLLEIAGKAMDNAYFTNHYSPDNPSPAIQEFLKIFQNEFKDTPDAPAALGYDSMGVLAHALNQSPQDLKKGLSTLRLYPGVTGSITMDSQRNAQKPVVILKIQEGKIHFEKGVL